MGAGGAVDAVPAEPAGSGTVTDCPGASVVERWTDVVLVLPFVGLGTSGAAPIPPVRLVVPWTTLLVVELVLLAALVVIAIVQVEVIRRLRLAPVLRVGEGVPAP